MLNDKFVNLYGNAFSKARASLEDQRQEQGYYTVLNEFSTKSIALKDLEVVAISSVNEQRFEIEDIYAIDSTLYIKFRERT